MPPFSVKTRRKLIETALPLKSINWEAAREKSIRHGHPSTLHLWWARRPLAAARAVIFAQMVDDPSAVPEEFPTPEAQKDERERLFGILRELVRWENTENAECFAKARAEILRSWRRACSDNRDHPQAAELFYPDCIPGLYDPFAGGGTIPLEAQRLGLEAHASDLNPIAVLINKAMIEIPSRFAGRPPVHPEARAEKLGMEVWKGSQGLAEDVRRYGVWMREEAERRIGHLYPTVKITPEMAEKRKDLKPLIDQTLPVIAWLWTRTVKSPNPAFAHVQVPLAKSFVISEKKGREAYVVPVIENGGYHFTVRVRGNPDFSETDYERARSGTAAGKRKGFYCLLSGTPINYDHIRSEGRAGRLGARLMALVAEGPHGRLYLTPLPEHEVAERKVMPEWKPEMPLPDNSRDFRAPLYGLSTYGDLFTSRQLVALTTFSDLAGEAMARVRQDAIAAGLSDDGVPLRDGGTGARAYAEAVGIYLALAVSKCADYWSSICSWDKSREKIRNTFMRQAIPMIWDYAEANPFSDSTGNWMAMVDWKALALMPAAPAGYVLHADAQKQTLSRHPIISTDPPYYDNIGYADLSDFFYVWLRRSLRPVLPDLFATLGTPKAEELIASPYRHGSPQKAREFFLEGMRRGFETIARQTHPAFPVTIYYAYKQTETDAENGTISTGWEVFLNALIRSGFVIDGTWPLRTEMSSRSNALESNALASSIVLVCRPRPSDARTVSRRDFHDALKRELPSALRRLQEANIAPVDLAQAAIGPGMEVFTRYARVIDAEGKTLSVGAALALINQVLDKVLAEQEGDFDAVTRFAIVWFEQNGFEEGAFGEADVLARAKNTSVSTLDETGIARSSGGKVRLLRPAELPERGDDPSVTVWGTLHRLIGALEKDGEGGAARLAARLGREVSVARELAYRLYISAERKGWAAEARSYNALVQSWPEIARLAEEKKDRSTGPAQTEMPV